MNVIIQNLAKIKLTHWLPRIVTKSVIVNYFIVFFSIHEGYTAKEINVYTHATLNSVLT